MELDQNVSCIQKLEKADWVAFLQFCKKLVKTVSTVNLTLRVGSGFKWSKSEPPGAVCSDSGRSLLRCAAVCRPRKRSELSDVV